jgi:hypothetical protein
MDLSFNSLMASMLVGSVGFVALSYGWKQKRLPQVITGIALMVYPYFVPSVPVMLLIAAGALGAMALAIRLGY